MKRTNILKHTAIAALAVFGLMNCGVRASGSATGDAPANTSTDAPAGTTDDYPWPSPEEDAPVWLKQQLMSDEGRAMTGQQLAALKDTYPRSVALPVSEADVLPRMGTYTDPATGGTITFMPYKSPQEGLKDTINPIALVAMRTVTHEWEDSKCVPAEADTVSVQNRGGGILSLYRIVHGHGPDGGKHRCYDKHPNGYPEYWGTLISVYPGADSLVMTVGYEGSKRVYKFISL